MKKIKYFTNYILIFLLLFLSGFPAAIPVQSEIRILLLLFALSVFLYRRKRIDIYIVYISTVFGLLTLWHFASFNINEPITALGIFLRLFMAYFIVRSVGKDFPLIYVKVMLHLTIISLVFWTPAFLIPGFRDFLVSNRFFVPDTFLDANYFLFHTNFGSLSESVFTRNSGPFWEPGAFGGYLIIALIFLALDYKNSENRRRSWHAAIVFIIGVISTFSTTTYLAFFLLSIYVYLSIKFSPSRLLVVITAFVIYIIAFVSLDFMKEKIMDQIDRSQSNVAYNIHRTRISSALIDLDDWTERPLLGRGKFETTRFDNFAKALNRNNGTTDFLVIFGIVGFLVFFYSYYLSFKKLSSYNRKKLGFVVFNPAWFMVFIILLLGFSENYFLLPFFWSLVFLHVNYNVKT